jgi:cell division protein FtsQ
LIAACAGMLVYGAMTDGGRATRTADRLIPTMGEILVFAGFGIDQVAVSGQRFTSEADIFDALDLANVRSFADLDSAAARKRIERLAWVATAELTRVYPGGLNVRVTERKPFAVWRRAERSYLIDATGRVLSAVSATTALELPRFSGEGAAEEAAALMTALNRVPDVARHLVEAERVAERRWTIRLKDGVTVHLPADREVAALEDLLTQADLSRLVSGANRIVDLRASSRVTVRPAAAARSAEQAISNRT